MLQTLGIKYDKERKEEVAALRRLRNKKLRGEPLLEAELLLLQTLGKKYDKERKEDLAVLKRQRPEHLRGKPLSEAEHI